MTRYVWHEGQWMPVAKWLPVPARAPHIISDHMQPLKHPCTGQIIDSKSAFRAITRANSCVELGNDAPTAPKVPAFDRTQLRSDITTAIQQLERGRQAPELAKSEGETRHYS